MPTETPFFLPFLAQDGTETSSTGMVEQLRVLHRPDHLLDQLTQMPLIAAAVVVVVGVLCVFNGYRWHKWVVAILAFFAGLAIGHTFSAQMGRPAVVAAAVGCLCAIIATPLLKISVAIFGGLTGAFIGINAWTVARPEAVDTHWAGAVIGFIVLAMASLILYRLVVVLFTSVGGAAMVVFGGITLLMHVPAWTDPIREGLLSTPLLIPLLLALAAVGGFVLQESRMRADGLKILSNDPATTAG